MHAEIPGVARPALAGHRASVRSPLRTLQGIARHQSSVRSPLGMLQGICHEAVRSRDLPRLLTTAEAASYLRFRSTSGIRTAVYRGELHPVGAGPKCCHMFTI